MNFQLLLPFRDISVLSYTVPITPQLTISDMQCNYHEVHAQFQDTFEPHTRDIKSMSRAPGVAFDW